jgi:hypothetical protein
MGLCVMAALAAFAISAMAASSASAGTYYSCVAKKKSEYTSSTCLTKDSKKGKGKFEKEIFSECVAQKKGEYTNATCTTKAAKKGKGSYEKKPGIKIEATTGKATLATPAFGSNKVECTSSITVGEITGAKSNSEVVTFKGCKFEGLPCKTVGDATEELTTNKITSKLIDNGEKGDSGLEPALGEVWNELYPSTPPYFIEFECGGVLKLRTEGSISGVYTAGSLNHMSETGVEDFAEGLGEQDLLTEAEEGSGWVGPAPSIQTVEGGASIKTSAYVEVRS